MIQYDRFLWIFLFVLLALLIAPTVRHLFSGWKYRRDSILNAFDEKARKAYFDAFQPGSPDAEEAYSRFEKYYDERFGRRHFILPLILLLLISGLLLFWSGFSIQAWLSSGHLETFIPHRLSLFSVVAISGAYLYCISDQIRRWYTLVKISDIPMGGDTQLKELNGIDLSNAERFAAESITTIAQLAYSDPVDLTMRTNFDYSYIVDCLSQALLFIYVGNKYIDKLALHGIRGSYEMRVIWMELDSKDKKEAKAAEDKLRRCRKSYRISVIRSSKGSGD